MAELQGETLRLLMCLTYRVEYGNFIPGPNKTALVLGMKQPNASRAYKELMAANLMWKWEARYRLSPLFCWKGDDKGREAALYQFKTRQYPKRTKRVNPAKGRAVAEAERLLRG